MSTTLQVNSSEIAAQHQAAILASLSRRIAVAKASQNAQLMALLEQERCQLDQGSDRRGLWAIVRRIQQGWNNWMRAIDESSRLSVERIVGDSGAILWRAYDPMTGKTFYAESTSEVVQWIEDNHLGQ
jgi:plasmid maintenance system killer protein